jgi:hypothetical protein
VIAAGSDSIQGNAASKHVQELLTESGIGDLLTDYISPNSVSDAIHRRLNEHEYFMVTTKQRIKKLKSAIVPSVSGMKGMPRTYGGMRGKFANFFFLKKHVRDKPENDAIDVIDEFLEIRELAALEMQVLETQKFREHQVPANVVLL